ncbi:MAG TPA: hypothetical protein ENI51_08995, partial [Candidatus Atribacteria bacterium]|nr:hypothetical protein [Candidatus Atribacteria bacterium]
ALDKPADTKKMMFFSWLAWSLVPMAAGYVGLIGLKMGLKLEVASDVFPRVLSAVAPSWIVLLFVLFSFNAIASTLDSMLVGYSAIVTRDLYGRYVCKEKMSDKKEMKISRVVVFLAGITGMMLALRSTSILFLGIYTSGFFIAVLTPIFVSFFIKRVNVKAVLWAEIIGFIVALTLSTAVNYHYITEIAGHTVYPWHVYVLLYIIAIGITCIGSVISPGERVTWEDIRTRHLAEVS